MTVNINNINANFSNPSAAYTAFSLYVSDVASDANSLVMHISVNNETRMALTKKGCLIIRANTNPNIYYPYNESPDPYTSLLEVYNNSSEALQMNPQGAGFYRPIWAQSHAEGHEDISYQGNNVLINLQNASFFSTNTANINAFNIKWPLNESWGGSDRIWTFSLLIYGPCDINPNAWWDSGRYHPNWSPTYPNRGYDYLWANGGPPKHIEGPTIITIQHGRPWNSSQNLKWLGTTSGQNYLPVLA